MKKKSKAILRMRQMPSLKHKNCEPFDIEQSEVLRWLLAQREVKESIFNWAKDAGVIVYDPETGTWKGCDT
jgi:hypothetical protein